LEEENEGKSMAEELLAGKQEAFEAVGRRIQALELAAVVSSGEEAVHVQELTSSRDALAAEKVRMNFCWCPAGPSWPF